MAISIVLATIIILRCMIYTVYAQQTLPELPTRFTAIVEANIIQKNETRIMEEWYDAEANKAKRVFYHSDIILTTYEDFSDNKDQLWSYATTHDDTSNAIECTLQSYREHRKRYRNDESQSGNLVSSAEWFQFGGNLSETYLGSDFVIRGISAEGWTRNFTYSTNYDSITMNTSYQLTYYFALETWDWFKSSQHRIPVRVDLTGNRISDNGTSLTSHNFHHYYDYVQFFADDLMLEEGLTFDIPDFYSQCNVTSYCTVYPNNHICDITKGPALPNLPYSFILSWEWSSLDSIYGGVPQQTSIYEIAYDYENERAHSIFRAFDGYDDNAYHQMELLKEEDGGQVWMWVGDDIKNCAMFGASMISRSGDYSVINGSLLNPTRLLLFNDKVDNGVSDEIWMGYTQIRGIKAEKWKATFNISINGGEVSIFLSYILPLNQRVEMYGDIYWYFSSANWSFAYQTNDSVRPLAMEMKGVYQLYNWSEALNDYTLVNTVQIDEYGHAFKWLKGTPDESWFKPPTFWRKYCVIDDAYCNQQNHEEHSDEDVCDEGLDLPTLPQHKYFVVLEGTDVINQTTFIIKSWYHYDGNEYRSEYYIGNQVIVTYDDLDEDMRWSWVRLLNDTDNIVSCSLIPFTSSLTPGNEQYDEEYPDTGHIKTAADLWRFGTDYNITYLGNAYSVRGINALAWHKTDNTAYTIKGVETEYSVETIFYFADDDWDYYKAIETSDIPLKLVYRGTQTKGDKVSDFNFEFHVVSFFSGDQAFDEEEMEFLIKDWYNECNTTAYCQKYSDSDVCTEKQVTSDDDKKGKNDEMTMTIIYIALMCVLFIIGLLLGAVIDRWLVRRKGYATFKNEATADGGL